jgi:actin-related protein
MVTESIGMTDIDIRRDLYVSVIIAGGNCMLNGMEERVQRQVTEIAPQTLKVKVLRANEIKNSAWLGGSILSSLGSF